MSTLAVLLIVVGGLLQILGVVGVLVELRSVRRWLERRDATVRPATIESTAEVFPPTVGTPTPEQRLDSLQQAVDELADKI